MRCCWAVAVWVALAASFDPTQEEQLFSRVPPLTTSDGQRAADPPAIPRVLFKTGRYKSEASLPLALQRSLRSIREQNPNYRLQYVNDTSLARTLEAHPQAFGADAPRLLASLRPGAYRADVGRLALLWAFGGIYSDLAHTYTMPLERIVNHTDPSVFLTRDRSTRPWTGAAAAGAALSIKVERGGAGAASLGEENEEGGWLRGIQVSFIASPPRSPLVLAMLRGVLAQVRRRDPGLNPLDLTGPAACYRHAASFLGLQGTDPLQWNDFLSSARSSHSSSPLVYTDLRVGLQVDVDPVRGTRLVLIDGSNRPDGDIADGGGVRPPVEAVLCFGGANRTKVEKNRLVYRGQKAKDVHYDSLWKARRVFREPLV